MARCCTRRRRRLARLGRATSLAALDAAPLAATALAAGRAQGDNAAGRISIERLGAEASTVLLVTFVSPAAAVAAVEPPAAQVAAPAKPAAPPSCPPRRSTSRPRRPRQAEPRQPALQTPGERRQPLRFVWQMDDTSRFTLDSDEFKTLIGPQATAALGQPWSDLAAALGLDPEAQVARAFASRDTWSGITVAFPLDGSDARLTVELSGLPVFDRDRNFRGYRGFGICRDVARINELTKTRRAADRPPLPASNRRCSARSARYSPRCCRR